MGVTAGVPPRVEAGTKAALLDLVDGAVEAGWTTARACSVLELDSRRCRRWQHRRGAGRLDDNTAGGTALHAITPAERRAVLELFERWGDIDGGYRKLAHRGLVSGGREPPPPALLEPYVTVSRGSRSSALGWSEEAPVSEELWLALTGSVEPSPCFGGLASQSFELLHRPGRGVRRCALRWHTTRSGRRPRSS